MIEVTTSNYRKHLTTNPLQRHLINNFLQSLLHIVDQRPVQSVLDVGCGEGFTLNYLNKSGLGRHLEGMDYSDSALALGKRLHPHLGFTQGDIYHLPYADDSFDLVVCTEVLEHLQSPEQALVEITRVSKKYCLLSVPNEPWFMIANFMRGKNWSRWGNDPEHIHHWSAGQFKNFVRSIGMSVRAEKQPFPWVVILVESTG